MNLFKTTLLGAMVAGLTCVNVSAQNPQDDKQVQNLETSKVIPPATEEEVLAVLEELKEEAAQHGVVVTNELTPLGYLTASGICATGAMLAGKAMSSCLWLFDQLLSQSFTPYGALFLPNQTDTQVCLNLSVATVDTIREIMAGNITNSSPIITCPNELSEMLWGMLSGFGSGIPIGVFGSMTVIFGAGAIMCLIKSIDKLEQVAQESHVAQSANTVA